MTEKKPRLLRWAVFVIYLAAVFFLVSRHENWRDEAQAWLLARDLNVFQLISQMKYEGHPCLWHLILMPFAKLGFPYRTMNLISTALVAAAAWLLLFRSPIPLPLSCVALGGCALLYYFPVISRSYALIPLFLFLNAMYYPVRKEHPLRCGLSLALLVQTHLYMIPIAGLLSLFWFWETAAAWRKDRDGKTAAHQLLGLLLPLISFLLFLAQITGVESSSAIVLNWGYLAALFKTLSTFHLALLGILPGYTPAFMMAFPRMSFFVILFLFFVPPVILCLLILRRHDSEGLKESALYLLFVGVQFFFYLLLSRAGMSKTSILALLPIWLLWVLWPRLDTRAVKAAAICVYCSVALLFFLLDTHAKADVLYPYTDAPDCAAFIEEKLPADALIFQTDTAVAASVLACLDGDAFYSLESRSPESFATWVNREPAVTQFEELCAWARELDPDAGSIYLLCGLQADPAYADVMAHIDDTNLIYASLRSPKLSNPVVARNQGELLNLFRIDLP